MDAAERMPADAYDVRARYEIEDHCRAALTASGWKVQHRSSSRGIDNSPIMRAVAPEMPQIYRGLLLREFVDSLAALITFSRSMYAANRIFQPTATGYQYGHLHMQRKVAKFAAGMLTQRINAQR